MTTDQHHLAGAYALDALTPDERRAFEAHYPTCEICSAEVEDFRATAARLAEATATPPPSDLKARVMADIAVTPQMSPVVRDGVADLDERRGRRTSRPVLLAVAAAAAVVLIVFVASVAGLRDSADQPSVEDLIAAPGAVATDLEGEAGVVTVVWSPDTDEVAVVATNMPDAGPGRAYALWFVTGDGVTPAGLFTPTGGTISRVLDVADLDPDGWGITNEPESGSPQPTGEILYTGTV